MLVKAIDEGTRIRSDHNTYGVVKSVVGPSDSVVGTEVFVATEQIIDPVTKNAVQLIGDRWLAVTSVNGAARSGWIALEHLGVAICNEVPEEPFTPDPYVKVTYANGKEFYYDLRTSQ